MHADDTTHLATNEQVPTTCRIQPTRRNVYTCTLTTQRQTRGKALLEALNKTASPTRITTHLSTSDNTNELERITERLLKGNYETGEFDSLHHAQTTFKTQEAADAMLEKKAQVLGLMPVPVVADGNCLQYAVNESHRQQTGKYIADNDDLRLLATALTRAQLSLEAAHIPQSIIEDELRAVDVASQDGSMDYPGTYMNALATIRHGPIIVLHETPYSSTTYQPLESMLTIMCGPHGTHPSHTRPFLPPVHILHQTSTNPPHFNATKLIDKQTITKPDHPLGPCTLDNSELPEIPRLLEPDTTP
jgi:hypothetical protein